MRRKENVAKLFDIFFYYYWEVKRKREKIRGDGVEGSQWRCSTVVFSDPFKDKPVVYYHNRAASPPTNLTARPNQKPETRNFQQYVTEYLIRRTLKDTKYLSEW